MASSRSVRAGRAFVEFFLEDNPLKRGLTVAERRLRQFGASVQKIGTKAFAAGFGGLAATVLPVSQMIAFDDAIRMTGAVSQSTDQQLEQLRNTALELGRTTSFTAAEVAGLMGELGRAGFSPDEIDSMTAAVLNLSRASGTDAVMASGIMAATLRQFSLGAEHATRVSDVLTLAANATFNSVEQLGEALSYAGPVAADLGMSLEDTVAILGTLGNVGIQGSNAGTALRRLGTITAAEADKMRELFGVEFLDAAGNLRPLVTVMGELAAATNNLPAGERIAKMNDAFGLLGITGATVMANTAADTQELAKALQNAGGVAQQTAQKMDAGPGGVWRRFMSALEGAGIAIGDALAPMLTQLGDWITENVGKVTEWIGANGHLIVTVVKLFAALAAGAVVLITIAKLMAALSVVAGVLGTVVTAMMSPWISIPVILGAAVVAIMHSTGALADLTSQISANFMPAWNSMVALIKAGDFESAMKLAWVGIKSAVQMGMIEMRAYFNEGLMFLNEIWMFFWDQAANLPAELFAEVRDGLQALVDWGNRLIGRDVPVRKSNVERLADEQRAREDQRQEEYQQQREAYNREMDAVKRELDAAVAAADQRAAEIKAADDAAAEQRKAEAEAREAAAKAERDALMAQMQQAGQAPPGQQLTKALQQGAAETARAQTYGIEAVSKNSVEGQRAIYEALDQRTQAEDTTAAVKSLEGTLEDEFERTRRENRQNPTIRGSRK
jgi:TP901 family phage tail tape measure protein